MLPPDHKGMRVRPPTLQQTVAASSSKQHTVFFGDRAQDSTTSFGDKVVARTSLQMWDVNTPGYRKRSAAGEIFNNPKHVIKENLTFPLIDVALSQEKQSGVAIYHMEGSIQPAFPAPKLTYKHGDYDNLVSNAITDAYAKVTANVGNTTLWIGELRESVKMLFDIGKGIRALYEKTKAQRKAWAKGKLTVEEAQGLTLTLLYGILPLDQQIADFMAGLFQTKDANQRHTARSLRVKTEAKSWKERGSFMSAYDWYSPYEYEVSVEEALTAVVRPGILYEFDMVNTPWLGVILEPKSIVSTAYALARLSFVIDWFINVGGTLAAWSPSAGIKELSAWVTVEITHDQHVLFHDIPASYVRGSGQANRTTKETWRVPISRGDLSLIPPIDFNLDIDKVLALVLLFAKVRKD